MSYYFKCVNCGKQTLLDGNDPGEPCEFCGKPAKIKEVAKMQNTHENLEGSPPGLNEAPKPELVHVDAKPSATALFWAADAALMQRDIQEAANPAGAEQEVYVASGKNKKTMRRGLYKWRKRCAACDSCYTHDEQIWCSSARCPQSCPKKLRPQYRPKIEEPPAGEDKSTETSAARLYYSKDRRDAIYHDLDTMPREEVEKKYGLSHSSIGQLIKNRKNKGAPAGKDPLVPGAGKKEGSNVNKAELEVELNYLRGWKDCAERFLTTFEKRL